MGRAKGSRWNRCPAAFPNDIPIAGMLSVEKLSPNSNPIKTNGQYQAYADKVTREVYAKTGYDPEDTPMKIYTYIDTDVQEQLDKIAYEDGYSYYDDYIQAGASVQETQTGRIVGVLYEYNADWYGTERRYRYDYGCCDVAAGNFPRTCPRSIGTGG